MSGLKALPMFHPELRQLPASPNGHRIILKPFPPLEEAEGGLAIPGIAQERPYAGTLLAVGDDAADKCWDRDDRIGDEVWWGKYTGVVEEWHHIVKEGNDPKCKHGDWSFIKRPGDRMELRQCGGCGAHKLAEPIIVANVEDILVNVSRQLRIERGEVKRVRGKTADGKTRYLMVRDENQHDTLESTERKVA